MEKICSIFQKRGSLGHSQVSVDALSPKLHMIISLFFHLPAFSLYWDCLYISQVLLLFYPVELPFFYTCTMFTTSSINFKRQYLWPYSSNWHAFLLLPPSMPPFAVIRAATQDVLCSEGAVLWTLGDPQSPLLVLLKVNIFEGLGFLRSQHRSRKIA